MHIAPRHPPEFSLALTTGCPRAAGEQNKKQKADSGPKLTQSKIKMRVCMGLVDDKHPYVTQDAVEPAITPENGTGRFVFVPRSEFGGEEGVGGWVGKIKSITGKDNLTTITFKDKKQYYKLPYVIKNFKPLTKPL